MTRLYREMTHFYHEITRFYREMTSLYHEYRIDIFASKGRVRFLPKMMKQLIKL